MRFLYSRRLATKIALFLGSLCFAMATHAAPISLNFLVDVTHRETQDGFYGINLAENWVSDPAYMGDQFTLEVSIDPGSLTSSNSLISISADADLTSAPATPFDAELDAALTRWPSLDYESASSGLTQSPLSFSPVVLNTSLRISAYGQAFNDPDIFSATDLATRQFLLRHTMGTGFFPIDYHTSGHLLTEQDLREFVQALVAGAAQFEFEVNATQFLGDFSDYLNDRQYAEGIRYRGTATLLADPGQVSSPNTVPLMLAALMLLLFTSRRANRNGTTPLILAAYRPGV